jgi:hypothetical protein
MNDFKYGLHFHLLRYDQFCCWSLSSHLCLSNVPVGRFCKMPYTSFTLHLPLPPAQLDVGFYPFALSAGTGALFSVAPSSNLGRFESASPAPLGWTLLTSASGGLGGPSGPLLTPAGRGGLYADLFASGLGTTLIGIPIFRFESA